MPIRSPPPSNGYSLAEWVMRLEVLLIGYDGTNGLRGTSKSHGEIIADHERRLREIEQWFTITTKAFRWGLIAVVVLIGMFGSDEMVDRILRAVKLLLETAKVGGVA